MQYKVKSLIKDNYLNTILKERGISQPQLYITPSIECLGKPEDLDNIFEGYELLKRHLENKSKIGLIVDCDCDGYTSAAIIYLFIKHYYDIEIDYYIHSGKQHGLEDQIDNLINKNYGLIIVPDAGSNDFEQQKELNEAGTDVLILDHHLVDNIDEDWYLNNEHTIIINNQLSGYDNKALSGAGVTWQFCRFFEQQITDNDLEETFVYTLMDLAAVGIIGDCMNMKPYENRTFSYYGLAYIYNPFLKAIIHKQAFSLKREENISPTGVSFFIVPLINSIIRVGSDNEKEKLFRAFVEGAIEVPSTKRGEKGLTETLTDQMAREGGNAKNRQDTAVERAMEQIDIYLQSLGLIDDNKVIIAELDDSYDFPSTLNGLVAMKLAAKYKKPVMVVREDNEGYFKGSARNEGKGEFKDFRSFLLNSSYFQYAQGHENAFGVSINKNNIDKFLDYANQQLKDIDFTNNCYNVEFSALGSDGETITNFIYDVYEDDCIWGQQNDVPLMAITDITLNQSDIQICGARKDTLRFNYKGITYIKFFATKDIEKIKTFGEQFTLTIIGEGAINEWNGRTSPQIIIKDYTTERTIFDF